MCSVALTLCLPFIAVYFMIRTFIFAFFARYRTVFQHPTRILLTFTHFGPGRAESEKHSRYNLEYHEIEEGTACSQRM